MESSIPAAIGTLANLQILEMNSADVTGKLPSELGELTHLTDLLLGENGVLRGGIPSEIGMMSMLGTCRY